MFKNKGMLFYDWPKIFSVSGGRPSSIVQILTMLVENRIPKNKYDKLFYYSQIDFSGESFLLHPDLLTYNRYKYTNKEIGVYAALASLRPLADYCAYGKLSLPTLHAPPDIQEELTQNRLLSEEAGEIHFLYERSPTPQEIH